MNVLEKIFRYGLAAFSLAISGEIFFRFCERPEPSVESQEFLINLTSSGYIWEAIGSVFLVSSLLLIFRRFVGLAMVLLLPAVGSQILFMIFLEHSLRYNLPGLILCLLYLAVGCLNQQAFASLVGR